MKIIHGHRPAIGLSKTYSAWRHMRQRCNNPRARRYDSWGGRGIKICRRWDRFENFLADMGLAPAGKSLDRRDNSRGYGKSNCRWATRRAQQQNTRRNRVLAYRHEALCVAEWARRLGMHPNTIRARVKLGWSVRRIIETPVLTRGSWSKKAARA